MARPQLVEALRVILRHDRVEDSEIMQRLDRRGVRSVSSSEIWLACQEHGIADLDSGRWVPRGWVSPSDPSRHDRGESVTPDISTSLPTQDVDDGLTPLLRLEIGQLRRTVGVSNSVKPPRSERPAGAWPGVVDEIIRGLQDEQTAATRRLQQTDVVLRLGHVVGRGATRVLMRFEADSEVNGREGMTATLLVEGDPITIDVISIYGVSVTISLPKGAPEPSIATLRCDLSWLIGNQIKRYREVRDTSTAFDSLAALSMLNPESVDTKDIEHHWVAAPGLNPRQVQAVRTGLAAGVTWLWGPPGTGKTSTLSHLLAELVRRRKRVLLTAPTNTAVDIALSATLRRLGDFQEGRVTRLGQPSDPALINRRPQSVLASELADGRGSDVTSRRFEATTKMVELRRHLRDLKNGGRAQDRHAVEMNLAELGAFIRALDQLMVDLRRQVCADATLVAATAHQVTLATLKDQSFDVVVIDEASMLPASLTALVAGAGSGHTIVAGDFRQLPPVVQAETASAIRWLGRSAFEASGTSLRVTQGSHAPGLVALNTQYRMDRAISDAVTSGFYRENPLVTDSSVGRRQRSVTKDGLGPLVVLDTSGLHTRVARRGGSSSRYNLMHAMFAAGLILDRRLIGDSAALISPYSPQARLLEALVDEESGRERASTVHRFQGAEMDVVVFDAVEAFGGQLKLHPWFEDGEDGSDGARLIDVAVSRARERLVLIVDLQRIHRGRRRDDAIRRFLRSALVDATLVEIEEIMPRGMISNSLDTELLTKDIRAAATSVEIWSERLSLSATRTIIMSLRDAVARGVEVTVWCEPPAANGPSSALMDTLRQMHVLRWCTPIRESCAIIDGIVWAAAHPLLAGGPGHVLRVEHESLAASVRRTTRRRGDSTLPGSSEAPIACGRCGNLVVRDERRSNPYGTCLRCDLRRPDRQRRI